MAIPIRLKLYRGGELIGTREFERDLIKVGRLANAHLSIDDEKASRIHLVINAEAVDKLSVVDMGSVEGTFLNGKRVSKSALNFGDEIRIGSTTLLIEDGSIAAAAVSADLDAQNQQGASGEQAAVGSPETTALSLPDLQQTADASETAAAALARIDPPAQTLVSAAASDSSLTAPASTSDLLAAAAPSALPVEASFSAQSGDAAQSAPFSSGGWEWHRPQKFGTYTDRPITPRRPLIKKGLLGLCVRYYWGDTLLDTFQLGHGEPVYVGEDPVVTVAGFFGRRRKVLVPQKKRCQFYFPPDLLGGSSKFRLAQIENGDIVLNLAPTMSGGVDRESGAVEKLEGGSRCVLKPVDFAWINIGGIRAEFSFERHPKPIIVPWYVGLDFRLAGFFFFLMFLVGAFVISASTYTEADIIADDIGEKELKLVKAFIKEAEKPKRNPLLDRISKEKKKAEKPQGGGEMAEKHKGTEGKMGRKDMAPNKNKRSAPKAIDINAKDIVKHAGGLVSVLGGGGGGGGLATIFGQGGLGGDIKGAIGNMHGPQVGDAGGFGGLGLRGTGTGGGGSGNTIGIGSIGTKGRGGGFGGYGGGVGNLGTKKKSDVVISDGESIIQGALDKELIRQVIQRNMGQIRYCYEKELARKPDLAGKVVIRFKIAGSGRVPEARVYAGTTLKDAALGECITVRVRNWKFPEPKGGGEVNVTYPFVFRPAGD